MPIVTSESREKPDPKSTEESKRMFYGGSSYYEEMAKEKMERAIWDYLREISWPIYGALLTPWATKERSH